MNILKLLAIIAIIAAAAIAAVYIMGQFEQTKPIADQATNLGNQIVANIQQNPAASAVAGIGTTGGLTAIGGIALSKISGIKQQAETFKTQASSQIDTLAQQKTAITNQLGSIQTELADKTKQLSEMTQRTAEAEKFNEDSTTIVSQLKTALSNKDAELAALNQTIKELKVTEKIVVK